MSKVSTYLNFPRNTEDAFNFYKSVFGANLAEAGLDVLEIFRQLKKCLYQKPIKT